jgi:hypothetical protein
MMNWIFSRRDGSRRSETSSVTGAKMPLPHSLRIANHAYRIGVLDKTEAEEYRIHGRCNPEMGLIEIDTSRGEYQTATALLHEILQAVYLEYYLWDWSLDDFKERGGIVRAFERGLMQVLLDNPDLLNYLVERVTAARLTLQSGYCDECPCSVVNGPHGDLSR